MPTIQSIDTSGLTRAIAESASYSSRTPGVMAATAGLFIAFDAQNTVRRASISAMDSALGVTFGPRLVTRKGHARFGLPVKGGKKTTIGVPDQSLATWIILARMKSGSNQNMIERGRWALSRMAFSPGAGKAGFWAKVKQMATTMVASRHSSKAFLASALGPVIRDLKQWTPPQYRRGTSGANSDATQAGKFSKVDKGRASLQQSGYQATMAASLLIGVGGVPGNLNEPHNQAMFRWMGPALQSAVYDEQASLVARNVGQEEMALRRAKFASCGVVVTI